MPQSRVFAFDDPDRFQAMFRAGNYEMLAPSKAAFRAGLTRIDFTRLQMQQSVKNGRSVVRSSTDPQRMPLMFLADAAQEAPLRNGMEFSAHEIVVHRPGATNHLLTPGPSRLAMISLSTDELAAEVMAITGRELTAPLNTYLARPTPAVLARLRALHNAACGLARTNPEALSRPATARRSSTT